MSGISVQVSTEVPLLLSLLLSLLLLSLLLLSPSTMKYYDVEYGNDYLSASTLLGKNRSNSVSVWS